MRDDGQQCLLVVDDTPSNLDIMHAILGDTYQLKVATNGTAALRIARTDPSPDLILLDIQMPGMNGYEVCRALKQDIQTLSVPIIFLSARAGVDVASHFEWDWRFS